jgi:cation-transporting ATPase E
MDAVALDGLSSAEVAERTAAGQTNAFEAPTSRTWWNIVRANVFTLFNGIVIACFAVLLLLGHWQDALFGFAAIFNTLIGCYQEIRAKIALDRLALLHAPRTRVRRDGVDVEVAQGEVVQDDLLVLRAGDQVAADAVVRSERGLQIDESMLTGESDPVDKRTGDELLSGSIVVGGEGTAQATRVGADSYANSFAHEARSFSMMRSELKRGIDRVLTWVGWAIGPVALLVTNSQVQVEGGWRVAIETGGWRDAAVSSIAIIIAMIPLGLVLMTSIAFAVGAARLASQQVLVQELPAVEGLARVDVICLDKTGTLTFGDIAFDADHPLDEVDGWRDALAWFGAAPDANATARSIGEGHPVTRELTEERSIPFSSARKWSAVSLAELPGTWVLGAPTLVFPDAAQIAVRGADSLADAVRELASQGKRTLVLAYGETALDDSDVEAERLPPLVPVALVTLVEQVRPDAAQTLAYFAEQDVTVKVISGDSPDTVATIARRVGLEVDAGIDAQTLPDDVDALAEVLETHSVFGRVTPDQKKAMVTALQSRGHVVAMTGDGVNDALAIKNADIGIAMESGSAATKAVARLVLLDGRFSHLPGVVAEGRRVTANIERVSMLFLTKTTYATAIAVLFGVLLLPIPFLPRQLSLTDGLTIGIPAFFLALLPNARRYVPGFLRRSLSFAIPAGVIIGIAITAYSRIAGEEWNVPLELVRTGSTLIIAFLGLWMLVLVALPFTWIKAAIVGAMVIGLWLALAIPFVADFFQMTPPTGDALSLVWWISGIGIVLIAATRAIQLAWLRRGDP